MLKDNVRARHFYERLGWNHDGDVAMESYGGVKLAALRYRILVV